MGFLTNFGLSQALGAGTSLLNFAMQNKTIQAQKQMQREQNEWNERMWNMNNEWNSPANQRKLLEEAGYNPAALKDSTAISNSPAEGVAPPNIQSPQLDLSPLEKMQQLKLQKLQTENIVENLKADTEKKKAERNKTEAETNRLDMLLPLEAGKLTADIEKSVADKEFVIKNRDWIDRLNDANLKLNDAKISEIRKHIDLMGSQAGLNQAQMAYLKVQADYLEEQLKYLVEHGFTTDAAWQTKLGNVVVNLIDKIKEKFKIDLF